MFTTPARPDNLQSSAQSHKSQYNRHGKRVYQALGPSWLVKTGGRLIKHARYYWLLLAESHLTRRLFTGMLRRIAALLSPAA
jgi:hypothetical protein